MLFSIPFKNCFMLKDYQRKKIFSLYFSKNFFYIFPTDSESILNLAFYDTDVEFVKILLRTQTNGTKRRSTFILYVSSQFFLVFISSLKGSILSKKFKIIVPYYTIYCTYCVHYAIKPWWQRSLCPIWRGIVPNSVNGIGLT